MKYPVNCKNIIDVTKPPYNVDNTGKVDCTETLCKILDCRLEDIAEYKNEN